MSNPIVIAYHLIWTIYGYWLPNDLRGSGSHFIRNDILKSLGEIHHGRKRIQPVRKTIQNFADRASDLLAYPIMTFNQQAIDCIADSFAETIFAMKYTCYACAIMPDHIHLVIRKHKHLAEEIIQKFQRESHLRLRSLGLFDMQHPIWGGPGWKVFLDEPDDIWRTIGYVDKNPTEIGHEAQTFQFVTPYNNWPLHEGHDPDSPYARRLQK